jgi:hypothetical protein
VKGVREPRALAGEPVDVRRLHVGMPGDAQLVEAEIIDDDDDDVRRRGHACLPKYL